MFGFNNFSSSSTQSDLVAENSPSNLSSVRFSNQNYLTAASWQGDTAIWSINNNAVQCQAKMKFPSPILDVDWTNNMIVVAGADNTAKIWDPVSNQQKQFGLHNSAISCINTFKDDPNIITTGSWDTNIKYWDIRKEGEVLSVNVGERVYSMDNRSFVIVVGVAQKGVLIFDARKPTAPVKSIESPLRMQTRCVRILRELEGIVIGSIEGRISVYFFENDSRSFNFKAHREKPAGAINEIAYAVNDISIHPKFGTFASLGSDGVILFWDKNAKMKLKTFDKVGEPIVSSDFNNEGNLLAYAASYDYSQGNDNKQHKSTLFVKRINESDIKPK